MASPLANTFEGGTNNTAISAANSGGLSGSAFQTPVTTNATCVYSNTAPHSGALGAKLTWTLSSGSSVYLPWAFAPTTIRTRTALRFYLRLPSVGEQEICYFVNGTNTNLFVTVLIDATNHLVLLDDSGSPLLTSTGTIAANTTYRIEVAITIGSTTANGAAQLAYYLGDNGTAVQSMTSAAANLGTTAMDHVRIGALGTSTAGFIAYYDDIALRELASGLIGAGSSPTTAPPAATIAVAAPAPVVTGIRNATVAAVVATVAVAALVPSVSGQQNATVVTPVATITVTAPAPVISGISNASVTAVVATVTVAAPAPSVTGAQSSTITTPTATVTLLARAPSVSAGANVTTPTAQVTVTAPAPTVAGNAIVIAPVATVTVVAPTPTVAGTSNATVTAPPATITVAAPTPSISAGGSVSISVPAATVSVSAPAPAVSGQQNATVVAPAASVSVSAPTPVVSAGGSVTISVPPAAISVTALAPTVSGQQYATVIVPSAAVTVTAPAPTVSGGGAERDITVTVVGPFANPLTVISVGRRDFTATVHGNPLTAGYPQGNLLHTPNPRGNPLTVTGGTNG